MRVATYKTLLAPTISPPAQFNNILLCSILLFSLLASNLSAQLPPQLTGTWDMWEEGYGPDHNAGKQTIVINKDGEEPVRFSYVFTADSTAILMGDIPFEGRGQYIGKVTSISEDRLRIKFHAVRIDQKNLDEMLSTFNEQVIRTTLVNRDHLKIEFIWDSESGRNASPELFMLTRRKHSEQE